MILAHHCIFSTYGFWLPNDPRGSGSDYVAVWELFRYGPATKVRGGPRIDSTEQDRQWQFEAKQALRYPPVELTGRQALVIIDGFRKAIEEAQYPIHACAILPDHVHLVVGAHERDIRVIVGHLKSRATRQLRTSGIWHADGRPLWGDHGWNVRLKTVEAVERAVRYAEDNPIKEGKNPQSWSFVEAFDLASALKSASQATRRRGAKRRIGGAALRSMQRRFSALPD